MRSVADHDRLDVLSDLKANPGLSVQEYADDVDWTYGRVWRALDYLRTVGKAAVIGMGQSAVGRPVQLWGPVKPQDVPMEPTAFDPDDTAEPKQGNAFEEVLAVMREREFKAGLRFQAAVDVAEDAAQDALNIKGEWQRMSAAISIVVNLKGPQS